MFNWQTSLLASKPSEENDKTLLGKKNTANMTIKK
jgi:hypothetical protein